MQLRKGEKKERERETHGDGLFVLQLGWRLKGSHGGALDELQAVAAEA